MSIAFYGSDDARTEKLYYVEEVSQVGFSFPGFDETRAINLHQVAFDIIHYPGFAIPAEQFDKEARRSVMLFHSCRLRQFVRKTVFGIAFQKSSLVDFECSMAFLPRAVISKNRFGRPARSSVESPAND